jgi:hypothetical protein
MEARNSTPRYKNYVKLAWMSSTSISSRHQAPRMTDLFLPSAFVLAAKVIVSFITAPTE